MKTEQSNCHSLNLSTNRLILVSKGSYTHLKEGGDVFLETYPLIVYCVTLPMHRGS